MFVDLPVELPKICASDGIKLQIRNLNFICVRDSDSLKHPNVSGFLPKPIFILFTEIIISNIHQNKTRRYLVKGKTKGFNDQVANLRLGSILPPKSETAQKLIRKSILNRYLLAPYFYTLLFDAHVNGDMIIRPIGFEFDLENEVEEQFMISNNVMVVPLLDSSNDVDFFLPSSIWCPLGDFLSYLYF